MNKTDKYLEDLLVSLDGCLSDKNFDAAHFYVREIPYSILRYVKGMEMDSVNTYINHYITLLDEYILLFENEDNMPTNGEH
jgi:hypothetical protein|tara:strand:+ start:580 stop:822 length:243 start_codon:yes stop_codon:yes gene_type:complete